jgi:hypothetical protein
MKLIRFGLIAALLDVSSLVIAGKSEAKQEDLKAIGSDPSEIISRLEIRNEYLGLSNDGHLNQTYLRGDYAPTENMVFRLDVPLADGSSENLGSHFGMGDLILGRTRQAGIERESVLDSGHELHSRYRQQRGSGFWLEPDHPGNVHGLEAFPAMDTIDRLRVCRLFRRQQQRKGEDQRIVVPSWSALSSAPWLLVLAGP